MKINRQQPLTTINNNTIQCKHTSQQRNEIKFLIHQHALCIITMEFHVWKQRKIKAKTSVDDYIKWICCHILWAWWRHQMETFSALLALCAGNSPVPGEFPAQRPVTGSFHVFFDLSLNKSFSKQSWGWWYETLSHPLWSHGNGFIDFIFHRVWDCSTCHMAQHVSRVFC